jgi:hypothetical protein
MNRFIYLLFFFTLLGNQVIAQGFSKTFLLPGSLPNIVASLTVDQDTIVCFGMLFSAEYQNWEAGKVAVY